MNQKIYILIVEDSLTQAEELRFILELNGYEVKHAIDPEMAMEIINSKIPKLIISDVVMPKMSGFDFCRNLKSNKKFNNIPVILLTSLSDPNDIINGLECGADSFITKPFNEEFLVSKIKYLLLNFNLRETQAAEMGIEVLFGGKKHLITSGRMQILDLLFSTYENAVLQNIELRNANKELNKIQQELKRNNQNLEKTVEDRTRELRKNQDLMVTLTSEAPIIMFSIDKDGIFTFSDGKDLNKLGLAPGQIVGLSAYDVYKEYPSICESVKKAMTGQEIRELEIVNELYFDTLYQPVVNGNGEVSGLVGVAMDVTQQKLSDAKLAESEEKFRNVFENSLLGKSITGIDGSMKVNKSFCQITGFTQEELRKKHWKEITHPDDINESESIVQSILKGEKQNAHFEKRYIHKSGKIIFTDVQTTLHRNEKGEAQFFISSIMDITKRKEAELALQNKTKQLEISNIEKEKLMATKDKLFSIIAHDLIGNYNPLLGFTDLLKNNFNTMPAKELTTIINTLHTSFNKQFQLLNNLLEWGRLQKENTKFNLKNINLLESLEETIDYLHENMVNKNISVEISIGDKIEVYTEKHMLDTIFRNLISNAIKFSNFGDKIQISAQYEKDKIQINIADNGIGIKQKDIDKILKSRVFLSTAGTKNEKGSGLGLILCREFIEMQGEKFELNSQFGHGTIVRFTLPYSQKEINQAQTNPNI